jgi:opacity protein-like surface antigen
MRKQIFTALTTLALLMAHQAGASMRNKDSTWYAGLGVFATTNSSTNASGATDGALDLDSATLEFGNAVIGYRPMSTFGNWGALRLEAEVAGRGYEFDVNNGGGTFTTNDLTVYSYMANALYEFHFFEGLNPIIGVGAGLANAEWGSRETESPVFAYQFIGGVTYVPSGWPHVDWSLTYNYFTALDLDLKNGNSTMTLDDVEAGSVNAAVRYFF